MAKAATQKDPWANRIVGSGEEDPEQLLANPFNFRLHPKFQQETLEGVLDEIGFIQNVIVNRRTGHLIDGHLRVTLALRREQPTIPVVYVDLSEDEEKLALATLDPLSSFATADADKLEELLTMTQSDDERVKDLLDRVAYENKVETKEAKKEREEAEADIFELREDARFPGNNKWNIPEIRSDMLATIVPNVVWDEKAPIDPDSHTLVMYGWGRIPDDIPLQNHVLAFWVEDYRFEVVWAEAVRMVKRFMKQKWGAIVAPDFSVWSGDPLALQCYNVYRNHWVARYWQEAGLRVIPNIGWSDERSREFSVAGIPKRPPVVGLQCRTSGGKERHTSHAIGTAWAIEQVQPEQVIVYGGLEHRDWLEPELPSGPTYHWLTSRTELRRKALDKRGKSWQ